MLPLNQVDKWAVTKGEIRSTGRNNYPVWTPFALKKYIEQKGGTIENGIVRIKKSGITESGERGNKQNVSRYKIATFFIRLANCKEIDDYIEFDIKSVRQNCPTITAKVGFENLAYADVKAFYKL